MDFAKIMQLMLIQNAHIRVSTIQTYISIHAQFPNHTLLNLNLDFKLYSNITKKLNICTINLQFKGLRPKTYKTVVINTEKREDHEKYLRNNKYIYMYTTQRI